MANPRPKLSRAQLLTIIDTQEILKRLQQHFMGQITLTNEQIRSGLALLARTCPEIKQTQTEVTTFDGDPSTIDPRAVAAAIVARRTGDDAAGDDRVTH